MYRNPISSSLIWLQFKLSRTILGNIQLLGPVYTKRQHQRYHHSAMTLVILFSLKSMETFENGLQTHSGASSQSCRSVDTDIWCKRALMVLLHFKGCRSHTVRCATRENQKPQTTSQLTRPSCNFSCHSNLSFSRSKILSGFYNSGLWENIWKYK